MEKKINAYLERVSRSLRLTEADKNDILEEIKNHIYEAVNRQELLESVLAKLGEPENLARSYNHSYQLSRGEFKLSDLLGSIAFYSTVALSGMIVMTTLPILLVAFALTALFVMVIPLTNFIGITAIPFTFGWPPYWGGLVTGVPQLIMAIIIAAIFIALAYACWSGLKKYLKAVSSNYYKRRIG